MLARLDAIPGVCAARVESSGRFFWIELAEGADPPRVAELATGLVGRGARALPAADAEAQLERRPLGDPWLGADEVMTLSYVEARLLAVRLAGELSRQTGATPDEQEEISEALRIELSSAMERVHGEGGRSSSGWIYREWPAIAETAVERCAEALSDERRRRFAGLLPGLLAR